MKIHIRYISFFILLFFQQASSAVTLIETRQGDGSIEKIYVEGMKVRIDHSNDPGFVIIDGNKKTMHVVSHEEKQIMNMADMLKNNKPGNNSKFTVKFFKEGNGPKIAGYSTKHYIITVNGKKCSDEFTSKKMLKDLGIQKTFERVASMFAGMGPSGMDMMQDMDPCMMAEEKISSEFVKYGYPMRSLDANGALESEVINLTQNTSLPAGGFNLPNGYPVVDMGQMMQGMMPDMQNMPPDAMQGMPPGMDPEQMKQMMEKMMQQMGQQMEQQQ